MSINGNILIDKLRICIPLDTLAEIEYTANNYIAKVRMVLNKYYPSKAYSINNSRNEIKITPAYDL